MSTIQEQIEYVKRVNKHGSEHCDQTMYESILESLNRLKAQEDLIDQQADEHNGITNRHIEMIGRAVKVIDSLNHTDQFKEVDPLVQMVKSMGCEIDHIKELTIQIANRFGITLIDTKVNGVPTKITMSAPMHVIDDQNGGPDTVVIDPAVLALIGGDPGKLPHSRVMNMYGLINHDIAILEELFKQGRRMTQEECDGILDNMNYKTTDLDLLRSTARVLSSYLPF